MPALYKHNRSETSDQVTFLIVLLFACFAWVHRSLFASIKHWSVIATMIAAIIIVLTMLARLVYEHKSWRRSHILDIAQIDTMNGIEFEYYVARLIETQGFGAVRLTEKYDYGIDIIAVNDGVTWGIQAKRYYGLVKANAVRQVVTALNRYHCDRAMVITNSFYSNVAKELAKSNDCVLIDRSILMRWAPLVAIN